MLASSIPPKFPIPFAASAGSADIRSIPVASQITTQPGAASLTDGFPPLNFQQIAAGGIPPFGEDFNGIFNQITKWNQWQSAGGPIRYDAAFASAIGGYPSGSLIQSNSGHAIYQSLTDNNTADPNGGSSQWRVDSCVWTTQTTQATGSANIQTLTLAPAPTALSQLTGIPLTISSQGTNTGAVTMNVNGLGATPIQFQGSIPLGAGVLSTNAPFTVMYNGTVFVFLSGTNVFTDASTFGLIVDGTANSNGANLEFKGNGATTSRKTLRVLNGVLQVVNSAYTAIIAQFFDNGNVSVTGAFSAGSSIDAGGNITANGARIRASLGATGSGDNNSGTILGDFALTSNSFGIAQTLPTGIIMQAGQASVGLAEPTAITFPKPFPSNVFSININEANAVGSWASNFPTVFGVSPNASPLVGFNCYCLIWNGSTWVQPVATVGARWVAFGN